MALVMCLGLGSGLHAYAGTPNQMYRHARAAIVDLVIFPSPRGDKSAGTITLSGRTTLGNERVQTWDGLTRPLPGTSPQWASGEVLRFETAANEGWFFVKWEIRIGRTSGDADQTIEQPIFERVSSN